jgi:hypothetical protein
LHACDLDHQALGCAYGDKPRQLLEHTMLWNGQQWQSNKEIPGESKAFKQVVHTRVGENTQTKVCCLPDVPPEAATAAVPASKAR